MYYCFYQNKNLEYFYEKFKFGEKAKVESDCQSLNFRGVIKTYIVIIKGSNSHILEKIEFNIDGNFVSHFKNNQKKEYEYYNNKKIKSVKLFDESENLIGTEFFRYDTKWVLESKRYFAEEDIDLDYTEYYEYDRRKNITAIIRQLKNDDEIETIKYDINCNVIVKFYFTNKRYEGRTSTKVIYSSAGKKKIYTHYNSQNEVLSESTSLFNNNKDIISVINYNFMLGLMKGRNSTQSIFYKYVYDQCNNWISRIKYVDGDLDEELEAIIEYF